LISKINFTHNYYKLNNYVFTTIRTTNCSTNYNPTVIITKKSFFVCYANVHSINFIKLKDIPLEALKFDVEYPNFSIESHDEFIAFLNTFYPQESININSTLKLIILTDKKQNVAHTLFQLAKIRKLFRID